MKKIKILLCVIIIPITRTMADDSSKVKELVKDFYQSALYSMKITASRYSAYYGTKLLSLYGILGDNSIPETVNSLVKYATPMYWITKFFQYRYFVNQEHYFYNELTKQCDELMKDVTEFLSRYIKGYIPETLLHNALAPDFNAIYNSLSGNANVEFNALFFAPLYWNVKLWFEYIMLIYRAKKLVDQMPS